MYVCVCMYSFRCDCVNAAPNTRYCGNDESLNKYKYLLGSGSFLIMHFYLVIVSIDTWCRLYSCHNLSSKSFTLPVIHIKMYHEYLQPLFVVVFDQRKLHTPYNVCSTKYTQACVMLCFLGVISCVLRVAMWPIFASFASLAHCQWRILECQITKNNRIPRMVCRYIGVHRNIETFLEW